MLGSVGTIPAELAANIVSEAYVTVIAWLPALKLALVKDATPFVFVGICFTRTDSSQNETIPEGFALVGPIATVADVKTTALLVPASAELRVVTEARGWTFCPRVPLPPGKAPSPL